MQESSEVPRVSSIVFPSLVIECLAAFQKEPAKEVVKRLCRRHVVARYQWESWARTLGVDEILRREIEPHALASRNIATASINRTPHKYITRSMAPPPPLPARVS